MKTSSTKVEAFDSGNAVRLSNKSLNPALVGICGQSMQAIDRKVDASAAVGAKVKEAHSAAAKCVIFCDGLPLVCKNPAAGFVSPTYCKV